VFICVLYRSYAFSFKKIPMHNCWEKDRLFPQKVSVLIIIIFMFSVFQIGTDSVLSAYVGQEWLHTRGVQVERWRNGGGVVGVSLHRRRHGSAPWRRGKNRHQAAGLPLCKQAATTLTGRQDLLWGLSNGWTTTSIMDECSVTGTRQLSVKILWVGSGWSSQKKHKMNSVTALGRRIRFCLLVLLESWTAGIYWFASP
jgi:hypothetical protein